MGFNKHCSHKRVTFDNRCLLCS
ncbi:MAG: hypothetical protein ACP5UH_03200 [Candidatus Micrarchaeia archaeon]